MENELCYISTEAPNSRGYIFPIKLCIKMRIFARFSICAKRLHIEVVYLQRHSEREKTQCSFSINKKVMP